MIGDTILALASPPGPAARAVVRLSGPCARNAAAAVFAPALPAQRGVVEGAVHWRGARLPAFAMVMPAPASFTGEDVVELHVPGSPLLVECLIDAVLAATRTLGVRVAEPGEFTRRAFTHGRLDLTQVEGVLQLVHGGNEQAIARGLTWLHGGLQSAIGRLCDQVYSVLATIESGLDFTAGETGEVPDAEWRPRLRAARAELRALLDSLPHAHPGGELLLLGAANAGKSSLCNALLGRCELLVDAVGGTTRDLIAVDLGEGVVLWDAPGDLDAPGAWDAAALALRDRVGARAAAALLVVDPARPHWPRSSLPVAAMVWTKADLGPLPPAIAVPAVPQFVVSAASGQGLPALRAFLRAQAGAGAAPGAPVRHRLEQAAALLAAADDAPAPEVAAAELQAVVLLLQETAAGHSSEAVLDRIFARFCLGK